MHTPENAYLKSAPSSPPKLGYGEVRVYRRGSWCTEVWACIPRSGQKNRHLWESNRRGETPSAYQAVALTTRPKCPCSAAAMLQLETREKWARDQGRRTKMGTRPRQENKNVHETKAEEQKNKNAHETKAGKQQKWARDQGSLEKWELQIPSFGEFF